MAYALNFAARRAVLYLIGSFLLMCAVGAVANAASAFI